MEYEEDYQKVVSFLAQLESMHARLDEREIIKVCAPSYQSPDNLLISE